MTPQPNRGEIVIYRTADNQVQLDVRMEKDTVWLSLNQIAYLYGRDKSVISRHIRDVYNEQEVTKEATVAKNATVQIEGNREIMRSIDYYNLDVIISVGYRIKSQRGVQFRQWASKILKDHLIKGYTINERIRRNQINELRQLVQIVGRTLKSKTLLDEGKPAEDIANEQTTLFDVVVDYTYALDTLDNYDYERLALDKTTPEERFRATYENAMQTIHSLQQKFGGSTLFGNEKDESFKSSIGQIYQTFDGKELYPSVEEKAAMLLYLVTKNHSFSDGNKRIAATLFLWFLYNNGILYREDGTKRIADNTLVALTLMIAESRTEEKDTMVKVVVNLINQDNE